MEEFEYDGNTGNPFVDDELYDVDLTFSEQEQNNIRTEGSLHSFTVLENYSSLSGDLQGDKNGAKNLGRSNGKSQNRVSARDMDDIALQLLQGKFFLQFSSEVFRIDVGMST